MAIIRFETGTNFQFLVSLNDGNKLASNINLIITIVIYILSNRPFPKIKPLNKLIVKMKRNATLKEKNNKEQVESLTNVKYNFFKGEARWLMAI